jgi:class 3 adenylate cyclase
MRSAELERLMGLVEKINAGFGLDEILDHLFDSFDDLIPFDRIGCALIEDGGGSARSVWNRSRAEEMKISAGYSASLQGSSLQKILDSGRPRILNDLKAYLREHPDSQSTRTIVAEGVRSSLTCPLVASGRPIGFLFFSSMEPNTYATAHSSIYLAIAQQLSLIIEKARIYQDLLSAKRDLERRNRFIKQTFGRYLSDEVVHELLDTPMGLDLGGEERNVTLLMADLRGFSALLSTVPPRQGIRLLNGYLGAMSTVIMDHGGTINEFLGDCIFAIFGAPLAAQDDARRAAACAICMQLEMEHVNRALEGDGLPRLEVGIALHTGMVVAGNVGCERRAKYGVVGTEVNLVSRLEACASSGEVLISEATAKELGNAAELDRARHVRVKGFGGVLKAYQLVGLEDGPKVAVVASEKWLVPVREPFPVSYRRIVGKRMGESFEGTVVSVSPEGARIRPAASDGCLTCLSKASSTWSGVPLEVEDDIELSLGQPGEPEPSTSLYARVTDVVRGPDPAFTIAFRAMRPASRAVLKGLAKARPVASGAAAAESSPAGSEGATPDPASVSARQE